MVQFAELFSDLSIVSPVATQLSWSHFIEILPLETEEARLFYAHEAATQHLGKRELRNQIFRKAYERREIANSQLNKGSTVSFTPCQTNPSAPHGSSVPAMIHLTRRSFPQVPAYLKSLRRFFPRSCFW